jgi:hypothetical protein
VSAVLVRVVAVALLTVNPVRLATLALRFVMNELDVVLKVTRASVANNLVAVAFTVTK